MINDIDEINVVIQDTDSVTVTEGTPTDIAEIMHNEEIRQENEAQRIENETAREDYINDLKERVEAGEFDGQDGEDGFSPIATVSKEGKTATISVTDKNGTTTATVSDGQDGVDGKDGADGKDGKDGSDGQDGYSPTASVSKSGSTATITITDKNGTTSAEVSDGTDGQDGQDGEDGYSPTATVTKSGKIATITITDKDGTTTAEIRDGEDGQGSGDMLKSTYDTDNNGIVDNAEKVNNHTVESDVPSGLDTILNNKQDIMQYSTMPTASSTYEGEIVQYIGTTGTYTNGYFYICTEDSGTYSWTNINVQNPGLPSDLARIYTCDTFTGSTSGDLFDACKQVYEDYTNGINSALYVHISTDTANTTNGFYIYYYDSTYGFHKLIRTENKTIINQTSSYSQITESGGVIDLTITNGEVVRINPGISTGQAAREVLEVGKDYATPYTPQYNGSPATKKYVDDNIPDVSNFITTSSTSGLVKNDGTIDTTNYSTFSGNYNDLSNKPTIPDELADLTDDSTHRVVTDTEKTTWNGKSEFIPEYTYIRKGSLEDPIIFDELDAGTYFVISTNSTSNQCTVKISSSLQGTTIAPGQNFILTIPKPINVSDLTDGDSIATLKSFYDSFNVCEKYVLLTYNESLPTKLDADYKIIPIYNTVTTGNAVQTIGGVKTFSSLPESSATPTTNNQLTNKSYVDTGLSDKQKLITQQTSAPSSPSTGDLWLDTDDPGFEITVDNAVSTSSTNPVENQAITNYVDNNFITSNGELLSGKVKYKKMSKLCEVDCSWWDSSGLSIASYGETELCVIPSGYRPSATVNFSIFCKDLNNVGKSDVCGQLLTNGSLVIKKESSGAVTLGVIKFHIMYFI